MLIRYDWGTDLKDGMVYLPDYAKGYPLVLCYIDKETKENCGKVCTNDCSYCNRNGTYWGCRYGTFNSEHEVAFFVDLYDVADTSGGES